MTENEPTVDSLLEERGRTHGEYTEHAYVTQQIMRACTDGRNYWELPDIVKESLHMFAHKMGRIVTGDPTHADHYDDIAGYARLVSQRIETVRSEWAEAKKTGLPILRTSHVGEGLSSVFDVISINPSDGIYETMARRWNVDRDEAKRRVYQSVFRPEFMTDEDVALLHELMRRFPPRDNPLSPAQATMKGDLTGRTFKTDRDTGEDRPFEVGDPVYLTGDSRKWYVDELCEVKLGEKTGPGAKISTGKSGYGSVRAAWLTELVYAREARVTPDPKFVSVNLPEQESLLKLPAELVSEKREVEIRTGAHRVRGTLVGWRHHESGVYYEIEAPHATNPELTVRYDRAAEEVVLLPQRAAPGTSAPGAASAPSGDSATVYTEPRSTSMVDMRLRGPGTPDDGGHHAIESDVAEENLDDLPMPSQVRREPIRATLAEYESFGNEEVMYGAAKGRLWRTLYGAETAEGRREMLPEWSETYGR